MDKDKLMKLHDIQVEILDKIVSICNKNQLEYFLIGGTLLGAVRHKGFIPWDDDLDIVMPRKDYEKFLDCCESEFGDTYYLQCSKTDVKYFRPFAKVMKNNTVFLEKLYSKDMNMNRKGIFVDIFPLDNAKKQNGLQKLQKYLVNKMTTVMGVKANITKIDKFKTLLCNMIPYRFATTTQQKIMSINKNENSKYFVNLGSQYNVIKQTIAKDKYFPAKHLEFEGELYCVPRDYEFFLERIYGSGYMELPPLEKRVTHDPYLISFDAQTDGLDLQLNSQKG